MRSISDAPSTRSQYVTKFHNLTTSSYYDSHLDLYVPIPFSYSNNVLDINNNQNKVEEDLIHAGYMAIPFSEFMVRQLGGKGLVTGVGLYFETYIKNVMGDWYGQTVTNVRVHTPGVVTKVQQPTLIPAPNTGAGGGGDEIFSAFGQFGSMSWSDVPPSSSEYIYRGSDEDSWNTFWVFLEPLTLSFKTTGDGHTHYVTFSSQFTKNFPISGPM